MDIQLFHKNRRPLTRTDLWRFYFPAQCVLVDEIRRRFLCDALQHMARRSVMIIYALGTQMRAHIQGVVAWGVRLGRFWGRSIKSDALIRWSVNWAAFRFIGVTEVFGDFSHSQLIKYLSASHKNLSCLVCRTCGESYANLNHRTSKFSYYGLKDLCAWGE